MTIDYSLEARIPFEASVNYFSEFFEEISPKGIEFKNLSYSDKDDSVILCFYNKNGNGVIELDEGFENVEGIQVWRDNNFCLNVDIATENYLSQKGEIDIILNQIATINQTSYTIEEFAGRMELTLGKSSEFDISKLLEYKSLLERLLELMGVLDATVVLTNNMFSYQFATLSVAMEEGLVKITSGKL